MSQFLLCTSTENSTSLCISLIVIQTISSNVFFFFLCCSNFSNCYSSVRSNGNMIYSVSIVCSTSKTTTQYSGEEAQPSGIKTSLLTSVLARAINNSRNPQFGLYLIFEPWFGSYCTFCFDQFFVIVQCFIISPTVWDTKRYWALKAFKT